MTAMESVATHLDESTGYFVDHWQLLERIERADKSLDRRIAGRRRATAQVGAPRRPRPAGAAEARRAEAVDFDPEVAAIFTDEATELLEASRARAGGLAQQPATPATCACA